MAALPYLPVTVTGMVGCWKEDAKCFSKELQNCLARELRGPHAMLSDATRAIKMACKILAGCAAHAASVIAILELKSGC